MFVSVWAFALHVSYPLWVLRPCYHRQARPEALPSGHFLVIKRLGPTSWVRPYRESKDVREAPWRKNLPIAVVEQPDAEQSRAGQPGLDGFLG